MEKRLAEGPPWLVRIHRLSGGVVGAGFLADDTHVLTCAHVIRDVIGEQSEDRIRQTQVPLDFPYLPHSPARTGLVCRGGWWPEASDGTGDIAVLRLKQPPTDAIPAPLRQPPALSGVRFSVMGYPSGPTGIEATGVLRSRFGPGVPPEWVQMEGVKVPGASIERGFSGAPVWAEEFGSVVGMVVAKRSGSATAKIAFMIPTAVLARYWTSLERSIGWRLDLDPELSSHWLPRARGVEPYAESAGSYFVGRHRILQEVIEWMSAPIDGRVFLVTGAPGSGKSAILARIAASADPRVAPLIRSGRGDESPSPPKRSIHLAFHAKGKSLEQLVEAVNAAADVDASEGSELVAKLRARGRPFTLLVDALDEADGDDGVSIARLLSRLAYDRDGVGLRVLVGARTGIRGGAEAPWISALGHRIKRVDVDDLPWLQPEDLRRYVELRLLLARSPNVSTPYRGRPDLAKAVAAAVAEKSYPLFLVAQLASAGLAFDSAVVDPMDHDWQARLPADVSEAMADYLRRFGPRQRFVQDLLTPLAYAEGEGLPANEIWTGMASALSGQHYARSDLQEVLESAASYLVETSPLRQALVDQPLPQVPIRRYRLFHQALGETLQSAATPFQAHSVITRTLIESVPTQPLGIRKWAAADPYVLAYLGAHAARCNGLDELLVDPGFLAAADVSRLLPFIDLAAGEHARSAASVFRLASGWMRDKTYPERASYLEFAAGQIGNHRLADRIRRESPDRPWAAQTLAWQRPATHVVLGMHRAPVHTLAVSGVRMGERTIAVSCADDGTVRLWDLNSLGPIGETVSGEAGWISAIAVGEVQGRSVLCTGGEDGNVRLFDMETLNPIGKPLLAHAEWVAALSLSTVQGRAMAVSGGAEGTIRLWDLDAMTPIGEPILGLADHWGHHSRVTKLALTEVAGHLIAAIVWEYSLASVFDFATMQYSYKSLNAWATDLAVGHVHGRPILLLGGFESQVYDLETGAPLGEPLATPRGWTSAVASAIVGNRCLAISGGQDRSVRVWDLETMSPVGEALFGHGWEVTAVGLAEVNDRVLAISGGNDRTVRAWDLQADIRVAKGHHQPSAPALAVATGTIREQPTVVGATTQEVVVWKSDSFLPARPPLKGHQGAALAVAVTEIGGRAVAVTGGLDWTLRLWDLEDMEVHGEPLKAHEGPVSAVTAGLVDGWSIAVTGSLDRTLRMWDLDARAPLGDPVTGHPGGVLAVAMEDVDGRLLTISAGSGDGRLRVWDTIGRTSLGEIRSGQRLSIQAIASGRAWGRPIVVGGGNDGKVRLWDLRSMKPILEPLSGHSRAIRAVAVAHVGAELFLMSGGYDSDLRIWRLAPPDQLWEMVEVGSFAELEIQRSVIRLGSPIYGLSFLPPNFFLVACESGIATIRIQPNSRSWPTLGD